MEQVLHLFDPSLLAATIRVATPIALAALGVAICNKAGVFNLAVEGIMLIGAFLAIVGVSIFGNPWMGVAFGVVAGVAASAVFGIAVVSLRAEPIVSGLAINLLAVGLTGFLLTAMFGAQGAYKPPNFEPLPALSIPGLQSVPILGTALSGHTPIVYITILFVVMAHIFVYRTPGGLSLRSTGEFEEAAVSVGLSVNRIRFMAILWSGLACGLAGAHLSLGYASQFAERMTASRGFTGFVAAIFGFNRPVPTALASLFFGLAEALGLRVQLEGFGVDSSFLQMFPLVLAIVALSISSAIANRGRDRRTLAHTE